MPFHRFGVALFVGCALVTPSFLRAEDAIHQRIDELITVEDVPLANDAEFLRRVYLDLTGSIPSVSEARAFLADSSPDKRRTLIDRLLASDEHARHLSLVFDVMWMDRRRDNRVSSSAWREFLRDSFAENKPWNQLVAEILSADGVDKETRPAAKFMLDRDADSLQLTRDISRLFLGRDMECAQCHNHPMIDDYRQDHFYGIQAFLNRTSLFPNAKDKKATLAERAEGEVTFTNVFDEAKVEKSTPPKLPGLSPIKEPEFEKGKAYKVAPDKKKKVRPIPKFSRREQLAKVLTDPSNRAFARTSVNRFWALLMGRGLIHPVDEDHSGNPPSHPELLDLLTDEFIAHQFDVRWLLRELTLTKTYQRTSAVPADMDEVDPARFAVMALKPLTPEQLAFSVMQATGFTDSQRQSLGKNLTEAKLYSTLAKNLRPFVDAFGRERGEHATEFEATLEQSLFMKNGPQIRAWLKPRGGNLTDRIGKMEKPEEIVDELYLSVLTRLPSEEERQDIVNVLGEAGQDRDALIQEIAWALIASAEFRFNH